MTESNYNLSNFEANFNKFINNRLISRSLKRRLIHLFKDYCNYLKLNFPADDYGNSEKLFSAKIISSYRKVFLSKNKESSKWNYFYDILASYKHFLVREENIYLSVSENNNTNQKILDEYLKYLEKKSFSASTVKNYKADLKQLFSYLDFKGYSLKEISEPEILSSYAHNLVSQYNLASESVKRKLSAVATFLSWHNKKNQPVKIISYKKTEIKPKIEEKVNKLNLSKLFYPFLLIILSVSLSLGIFNRFYKNVKTPEAAVTAPKAPSRILSFQGRLTDKEGNPVTDKVDVTFALFDKISGGTELYSTDICSITPDQNGIFYTIIGSTCGKEITSTVFTENTNTFLGITVGTDKEMEPRQQIASVGYALNSETVQGIKPESPAGLSAIPYINKDGQLLIAANNPKIKSTSGSFTLEGSSISINATEGSQGSINLSPDGNGSINLNLEGFFPSSGSGLLNITAGNIISSSLISAIGSSLTAGYKLIDLSSGSPASSKFSVDAGGNTTLAGNLIAGTSFQSSASGTLVNSNLDITGQIYDGGMGIFGSRGNRIPTSINFTKDTVIEFNFKTASKKIEVHANINDDNTKYYLFSWDTTGKIAISKCSPSCTELTSDNFSWTNDSWHDGYISFSGTNLKWSIDKGGKTVNTTVASDLPAISTGYLKFSDGFLAIDNLVISPTTDLVLTAGNSWIGGRLATEDNITTTGRIGVGTGNPNESLDVEGNVEIDASGTSYTQRLCHIGADGDTNDLKLGDCSAGGADYAEYYGSDPEVSSGDIVAINKGAYQIYLPRIGSTSKAFVTKANKKYQDNIIGVVSTNPHSEILSESVFDQSEHPVPVALAGRIPIKVTSENGSIHAGDLITSGSIPGFGMKADWSGQIVGKALQDFSDNSESIPCPPGSPQNYKCGKILAFLNISFYNKPITDEELSNLSISPQKQDTLLENISTLIDNKLNLYSAKIITNSLKSGIIEADYVKTQNLEVGMISPLTQNDEVKILGNVRVFGELNSSIISAESASVSGTIQSENLVTDNLTTELATISGTLYADSIESKDLNNLKSSFGELIEKINNLTPAPSASPSPAISEVTLTPTVSTSPTPTLTPTASPTPELNPDQTSESSDSAELSTEELYKLISETNLNTQKLLISNPIETKTAFISPQSLVTIDQDIKFTHSISLADTTIAGSLMVDAEIVIHNNSISTITDTLFLTSPKLIDIMGGQLIVDKSGNLTVKGELIAEKGIKTGEIKPLDHQLTIDLSIENGSSVSAERIGGLTGQAGFGELLVKGNTDIGGELSAWKLNMEAPSSAQKTLSAAENFLTYNNNAPGLITNRTAGTSTISAGYQEFYVYSNLLTKDSLIYLTPSSSTHNLTLYIAKKHICDNLSAANCSPFFSIAVDGPFTKDISFNWWFVN